jgi:hypothetical protein
MQRPVVSRRFVYVTVLVALAVFVVSCSGPSRSSTTTSSGATSTTVSSRPTVAQFGDSLSYEARPYYQELVQAMGDIALSFDSFGGTAICDWLPRMREVETMSHPAAVVLQFSGNALTPCMEGVKPPSQAYYERYRADTQAAIRIFPAAHVYLIGAPITKAQQSDPNWDRLNRQYAQIADDDPQHVTYVDAGTAVEGPGHTFVQTLPCLQGEPCTGPVVDGMPSNTIRSTDGVHFCPVEIGDEQGVIGDCSVYSSGAFRYAQAMVEAIKVST